MRVIHLESKIITGKWPSKNKIIAGEHQLLLTFSVVPPPPHPTPSDISAGIAHARHVLPLCDSHRVFLTEKVHASLTNEITFVRKCSNRIRASESVQVAKNSPISVVSPPCSYKERTVTQSSNAANNLGRAVP